MRRCALALCGGQYLSESNLKLKRLLFIVLLALAALTVGLSALGYEQLANYVVPLILLPWGSIGIIEYLRGEPIQVTWYRVASDASKGERLLHLMLSVMLILVALGILVKYAV